MNGLLIGDLRLRIEALARLAGGESAIRNPQSAIASNGEAQ